MLPWNALPLNTIGIIIALSLLIPAIITLFLIKIKRYEELGWIIGIFLVILSLITYSYLIPNEIVDNARIPEDYIWEDEGNVYYWERNSVFSQDELDNLPPTLADIIVRRDPIEKEFVGKEIIHVTDFNKHENKAVVNDAIYDERGEILRVLNGQEEVSEWYEINTHLNNLEYVNVEAGRMGIPSNHDKNVIRVGWVDSSGRKDGSENVVLVRDMKKIRTGIIDGVDLAVWQSDINNVPIVWHGESYFCDETLRLTVNPQTGYIVNVYRHLVLSASLSQFLAIYEPELLNNRFVKLYLKATDPVGEGAELIYETTEESQTRHIQETQGLLAQITYYPIIICVPMFIIGLLLVWRYCGRGYYWKRYKEYDGNNTTTHPTPKAKSENLYTKRYFGYKKSKKVIAIFLGFILIFASMAFLVQNISRGNEGLFSFIDNEPLHDDIPPTPPGSNRAVDSGRHILEPSDEGPHDEPRFPGPGIIQNLFKREWWYFNVFFNGPDSDFKDWSMIISFNKMAFNDLRFVKRDNMFIVLYDDKDTNYDFSIRDQRRGTMKYSGPGVDVSFENCWAKGVYPEWEVHAENPSENFFVDLKYTADFIPVWVEGRASNLYKSGESSGDYYIARCHVEGTVNWDGKEYTVQGIGYHDHVWESLIPRFFTNGWDWFNVHFDNGWEMYISRFDVRFTKKDGRALVLNPNNRNIIEWSDFNIEYVESKSADDLKTMSYPVKFHITAEGDGMYLDLELEAYNIAEVIFRFGRTGMFEGPFRAKGTFSWDGHTVELNGYGFQEITRVQYLLGGFGLVDRIRDRMTDLFNR